MRRRKIGAGKENAFFLHAAEWVVGEKKTVLDGVHARFNDIRSRLSSEDVNRDRESRVMSFIDRGADFIDRVVIGAVVGDELYQVGAVVDVLADGLTDFVDVVGVVIFELTEGADFLRDAAGLSPERGANFSGGQHGGTDEPASVARLAERNGGKVCVVADVADRGDAGVQKSLSRPKAAESAERSVFAEVVRIEFAKVLHALGDVRMRVHHAGHHPFAGEVHDLGAVWNRDVRTHFQDLFDFNEDDLFLGSGSGCGIDQIARANRNSLRPDGRGEKHDE